MNDNQITQAVIKSYSDLIDTRNFPDNQSDGRPSKGY